MRLTDKQRADKMRRIADLVDEVGCPITAPDYRLLADELDPPDPYEGLDDDQWVEVRDCEGYDGDLSMMCVRYARACRGIALVRAVPDGDARDVLVIPVEQAREASRDSFGLELMVRDALAEHDERWSP